MERRPSLSLNCGGMLVDLSRPAVMGILNATPDSFYAGSRTPDAEGIRLRARQIREEGAQFIDVGAYSSRPGAQDIDAEEEMRRLRLALPIVREEAEGLWLSVDTFRADVARMCVEEFGVHVVNDISGGEMDRRMARTVAQMHVPYVLMHMQGTPQTMQQEPHYANVVADVICHLSRRIERLRALGVNDIIADPGFGFGKTLEHNYRLMAALADFHELGCPLLVGISRKSMITRLLGIPTSEALNATTALHAFALAQGAHILRVHDVAAAVEAVRLDEMLRKCQQ